MMVMVMSARSRLVGALLLVAGVLFAGCQTQHESPLAATDRDPKAKSVAEPSGEKPASEQSPSKDESADKAAPKAVAPNSIHDFGAQPPESELSHQFEIRNEGTAPLTLEKAGTTCSCTISSVKNEAIQPGKSGFVKLEWNVGKKVGPFSHSATIKTNDPKNPFLVLNVIGMTASQLKYTPGHLSWEELPIGQDARDQFLITSQSWNDFQLENIRINLEGVTHEVVPAEETELEADKAQSGKKILISIPAALTGKSFQGLLEFDVVPPEGKGRRSREQIEISGRNPKGIYLSGGPCHDRNGAVFGLVRQGTSKKCNLLLKAKGFDENFKIEKIITEPSFVKCQVDPLLANGKNVGVFRVTVEIPADAPECVYQTPDCGKVRLITNNPEKPEMSFVVEFTVIP